MYLYCINKYMKAVIYNRCKNVKKCNKWLSVCVVPVHGRIITQFIDYMIIIINVKMKAHLQVSISDQEYESYLGKLHGSIDATDCLFPQSCSWYLVVPSDWTMHADLSVLASQSKNLHTVLSLFLPAINLERLAPTPLPLSDTVVWCYNEWPMNINEFAH